MFGFGKPLEVGIDLGTASVIVYMDEHVCLNEPSVVAFDDDSNRIKAIGEEARMMIGRTPGNIRAIHPMRKGVIADPNSTEQMMRYFLVKAIRSTGRKTFNKPRVAVCVPSGVSGVQRKAVEEAAYLAGAKEVSIIEEPIAAAIGAGIDITKPQGNMIVDIGGGTTDIAVISLGGTVVSRSVPIAGNDFDEAILRYIQKTYHILIGERMAEDIKINIGTAFPQGDVQYMEVKGRSVDTGLPQVVKISSDETQDALQPVTNQILEAICKVLEETPPELAGDIVDRGIVLTGGGSLLNGLEELIEEKTNIHTLTAEEPISCVAVGTGTYIKFLSGYNEKG